MIRELFAKDWVVTNAGGELFVTKDGKYTNRLTEARRFTACSGGLYVERYEHTLSLRLRLVSRAMKQYLKDKRQH